MFTGIIEAMGEVTDLQTKEGNLNITIRAPFASELEIDQSIAHDGACLTVVELQDGCYVVTAIQETLDKTNISEWVVGSRVNLERAAKVGDRLDGHIVQGHVDQRAKITEIVEDNGSWRFTVQYDSRLGNITVEKGSVCVNGVSLTVVDSLEDQFSVAIIPYTYHHTNFQNLDIGDKANLEFDILGKYVTKLMTK